MDQHTNGKRILVLGVGNILYTDEGVGVRAVEKLEAEYDFSDNVELMDGGTLGSKLIHPITQSDYLIVIDAVLGGDEPGSIYRLTGDDLRKSLAFNNSLHDTDLVDTLIICEMIGHRPEAVIIGIEPKDFSTMSVELSEVTAGILDRVAQIVLDEVKQSGGTFSPKQEQTQPE